MELLQLRYFQTVARMEHMTKAAKELRIAQPALSKTIARLEEDLGVPLFDRLNRKIKLNSFGKAFLRNVETALSALEEGRREVADLAGTERGSIRLATTALSRMTKALGAFRKLYPEVNFRIIQIPPDSMMDMVSMLENGDIDLCFNAALLDEAHIREIPVLHTEVFLAVPHGHRLAGRQRISLQEVEGEAFIEYKCGHPFRMMNQQFCEEAGITRDVACEVDEPAALASLVAAGLGIAFVPGCRDDEEPAYDMVRIEHPSCYRTFTLAWQEQRYLSQAARQFQQFLVDYFSQIQEPIGIKK
ncbi:LysR family transcriptional regulator [Paenibacillus sp. JCM 10914]|uniref:LysR family transcriptional regulator n=1 Tax=Paenibacillus sp. JCM 10914 TaxID=1236974 RepID=UPI0003CC57F5|nr:LysR family transcriptional regulator [Paenibacillus sp. JCM 10914]GAE07834.1 LysR family transcriptional regulator Bsu YybE [Paenibacillus sp. JCM 10914]